MNQSEIDAAFRDGQKSRAEMPKYLARAEMAERGYAIGIRRFPDIPGVRHGLSCAIRQEWFGQFTAPSQRASNAVYEYVEELIV